MAFFSVRSMKMSSLFDIGGRDSSIDYALHVLGLLGYAHLSEDHGGKPDFFPFEVPRTFVKW